MQYTQIPTDTFEKLQLNAGILCTSFAPATGEVTGLIGATTGGIQFSDTPTFEDFGEDIDNCPKNTKELKRLTEHEVKLSGTFVTLDTTVAKKLVGAGDIDGQDSTKIVPRNSLATTDFEDIWWVGDYSNINDTTTGTNPTTAGFIAIKMTNALNTAGFALQTTDKAKGQFAFEFTGHYSISAQDTVPYELYVKAGA